jgi:type I restriction enzyme S subunit
MTRPNLNAVAIVPESLAGAVGSTGFHVLRAIRISPLWLYYLVQTNDFVNRMSNTVQGVVYPAVRPRDIDRYEIPLAPLVEQYRIVAEIEKLLTHLDSGIAALERIQARLAGSVESQALKTDRLRRSILQAAFDGKLVEHDPSEEPAHTLLESIRVDREKLHHSQRSGKREPSPVRRRPTHA